MRIPSQSLRCIELAISTPCDGLGAGCAPSAIIQHVQGECNLSHYSGQRQRAHEPARRQYDLLANSYELLALSQHKPIDGRQLGVFCHHFKAVHRQAHRFEKRGSNLLRLLLHGQTKDEALAEDQAKS